MISSKFKRKLLLFFATIFMVLVVSAQDVALKTYKLDNGLTVILHEDNNAPDVFGMVAVKTGSINDPATHTGLAHYLEHLLFKGTQELGTTDWEAEKQHYNEIISLYEEMKSTSDEAKKDEIRKKINEVSILAGQYAIPNEFSNLIQAMGGTGLNAGTSYDVTTYHNSFPSFQIEKWLELYAKRFVNPVFRGFQAELETVYEEKNMYSDNSSSILRENLFKAMYSDHPYGVPIIGTTEHLKNPSIKNLIEFYETWYVPNNMALILSGKFNSEEVIPSIKEKFGNWEDKELPARKYSEIKPFASNISIKERLTPFDQAYWVYRSVPKKHEDELAVELFCRILNNSSETGILDELRVNGDVISASASFLQLNESGEIIISAIPAFDRSQLKLVPLSTTEKIIHKQLEKLKDGQIEDWRIRNAKNELTNSFKIGLESHRNIAYILSDYFSSERNLEDINSYIEKIESITKEDIAKIYNKYIDTNHISFFSYKGRAKKDKIEKPDNEPITPKYGEKSKLAEEIEGIPLKPIKEDYIDFNKDVTESILTDKVTLHYVPNKVNEIFSLTIRFGTGAIENPKLPMAANLMQSAGIMAQFSPNEFKKEMAGLGCIANYNVNNSYLYVSLTGNEDNLAKACQLLSRQILMPALDDKQFDATIGSALTQRISEKDRVEYTTNAVYEYLLYSDKSDFIDRPTSEEINELSIKNLTGEFIRATEYEADVFYQGALNNEEVSEILKTNLVFSSGRKDSNSPVVKEYTNYNENSILVFHQKEAAQSRIYLFIPEDETNLNDIPRIQAFNEYFSGGFNGILLQEIRELNSMAYSASGSYSIPAKRNFKSRFFCTLSTQGDKTVDAIKLMLDLINDMPEKPERMENIKNYLMQTSLSEKPSFRNLAETISYWETMGYNEDPSKVNIPKYKELQFSDIVDFYSKMIKGKKYAIAIVGDTKSFDVKELKDLGKVEMLKTSTIYN